MMNWNYDYAYHDAKLTERRCFKKDTGKMSNISTLQENSYNLPAYLSCFCFISLSNEFFSVFIVDIFRYKIFFHVLGKYSAVKNIW